MATQKIINGNAIVEAGQTIYGIDVDQGNDVPQVNDAGEIIKGVSSTDPVGNQAGRSAMDHPTYRDTIGSKPSGYTNTFAIDVGDGIANVSRIWPTDDEHTTKGNAAYFKPASIQQHTY